MQNFNKKQIAVAVGALLAAGTALAGTAPALRGTNPVRAILNGGNALSQLNLQKLYTAAGVAGAGNSVIVELGLSDSVATTAGHVRAVDSAGAMTALGGTATLVMTDSATAGADLSAYVLDSTSAKVLLNALFNSTATLTVGDSTGVPGKITATLTTAAAADGIRLNGGKLQYSANATSTAPTWRDVKFDILPSTVDSQGFNTTTAGGVTLITDDGSTAGAGDTADTKLTTAITAQTAVIGATLAPTPVIYTRATNGLVDGVKIETFTPLASFAAANVLVKTANGVGEINQSVAVTPTAQLVSGATSTYEVFFATPATIDWSDSTAQALTDAQVYSAKNFNTGIKTATVPFTVGAETTAAARAAYTSVFDSTGTAIKLDSTSLAAGTGGILDGAAPTVIKAEYTDNGDSTSTLAITFSEGVAYIAGGGATDSNNLREILENISHKVSSTSTTLAAEEFNANAAASVALSAANGVANSLLTITNVPKAVLDTATPHTVEIGKRITVADPGDASYSTADALDTEGGLVGAAAANVADSTALTGASLLSLNTITATGTSIAKFSAPASFASAGGVTGRVFLNATATDKIHSVVATFSGGVALASGKTLADLANQFVLNQLDSNGTPYASAGQSNFKFYPDSTAIAVDSSAGTVTITLPTDLVALNAHDTWTLDYLGSTPLVNKTASAYSAGQINLTLPFTAAGIGNSALYTMDAKVKFTGAAAGSKVVGYLAKWLDAKQSETYDTTGTGISVNSAKVSDPGDKLATDLELDINNVAALKSLIAVELNKAKPAPIPFYIQMTRTKPFASQAPGNNANDSDYQQAAAVGSPVYGDLPYWAGDNGINDNREKNPVYVVSLDPVSGVISGRLSGKIDITAKKGGGVASGLAYIKTDGTLVPASDSTGAAANDSLAASAAVVLDGTNTARIFIGADAKDPKAFDGAFVLLDLQQTGTGLDAHTLVTSAEAGAKNFVPFLPSLLIKDPTKVVRTDFGDFATANLRAVKLASSTGWQLLGIGNVDRTGVPAAKDLARLFVTYNPSTGKIQSLWANGNDVGSKDMALTMLGNAVGLAAEATDGTTTSTISAGNVKLNAAALGWMNGEASSTNKVAFLTKTSDSGIGGSTGVGLPAGWSLVSVPAGLTSTSALPADVSAVLKVGAQVAVSSQVSWMAGDTNISLTQGEPVFVFSKKAIAGK